MTSDTGDGRQDHASDAAAGQAAVDALLRGGMAMAALDLVEAPVLLVDLTRGEVVWRNRAAGERWNVAEQPVPWRALLPEAGAADSLSPSSLPPDGNPPADDSTNPGGDRPRTLRRRWNNRDYLLIVASSESSAPPLDPLTRLPGRAVLERQLQTLSARGDAGQWLLAMIDLDDFKLVNDRWGHLAGDDALRALAGRLRDAVRDQDLLVRWGGDEFVVLAPWRGDAAAAATWAERIHAALAPPLHELGANTPGSVGASVGVALIEGPFDGRRLLASADAAMYQAKAAGGGQTRLAPAANAASGSSPSPRDLLPERESSD